MRTLRTERFHRTKKFAKTLKSFGLSGARVLLENIFWNLTSVFQGLSEPCDQMPIERGSFLLLPLHTQLFAKKRAVTLYRVLHDLRSILPVTYLGPCMYVWNYASIGALFSVNSDFRNVISALWRHNGNSCVGSNWRTNTDPYRKGNFRM